MLTTQRAEVFEAFFACARAGLVLVPLNTRLALPELQGIIADAAPEALLYDDAFAVVAAALDVPRGRGPRRSAGRRPRRVRGAPCRGATQRRRRASISRR
jgi:acyl-CoA synthetase (AMP-forming)/AMP-acid ligase II